MESIQTSFRIVLLVKNTNSGCKSCAVAEAPAKDRQSPTGALKLHRNLRKDETGFSKKLP